MVEEPGELVEGNFAIDFFKNVEKARDRLVVGSVQTKRPAILDQKSDYILEFSLQRGRQVRSRFEKVFKVSRREHQHLACPVHAIEIVTCAWPGHLDPA